MMSHGSSGMLILSAVVIAYYSVQYLKKGAKALSVIHTVME